MKPGGQGGSARLYDFLALGASVWLRPLPAAMILSIWIWRMRRFESVGQARGA